MLNTLSKYFYKICNKLEKPYPYGSALEDYIVSRNPKCAEDVEYLQRRFDQTRRTGWPL